MVVVNTAGDIERPANASKGLKPSCALIASGVTDDPMSVTSGVLPFQNWNITGVLTRLPAIGDEPLGSAIRPLWRRWTRIAAPVDGTLVARRLHAGDLATPGPVVVDVTPLQDVWVDAILLKK